MIQAELARRSTEAADTGDIDASKERCRTLAGFIREGWHVLFPASDDPSIPPPQPYVHGWHIDLMARHLEAITKGEFMAKGLDNRLLMNVPPGTMKSLLVMVFWLAWEWGPCAMPHLQAIASAYREDFCIRDQNRFRKLVNSDWYQARWPIKITKDSENMVQNTKGGFREPVPFGSLLGGRADRLLIDDPHSIDTAESDADRDRTIRNFRETAVLRLNNPQTSAIVVIMQRLHMKDLSGTILALNLKYVHIMLPMRFEPARACKTPFGKDPRTKEGELLFPERFPRHVVDRDEHAMTDYAVAGQNQQRPTPRGGLTFKRHWFKVVQAVPAGCRWVRGWDLAGTAEDKATNAATAGVLMAYHERTKQIYVAGCAWDLVDNPEDMILNIAKQDGPEVEIDIPQDPGAAGKIQARSIIGRLIGFKAYASPESGDKVQRADPFAAQAKAGNVFIVEGGWNDDYLDEIEAFPVGARKDRIDASSRAFSRFILRASPSVVIPEIVIDKFSYYGAHPDGQ